ncbi:hypothetical protein ACFE04_019835 [Oxalis oulophora]
MKITKLRSSKLKSISRLSINTLSSLSSGEDCIVNRFQRSLSTFWAREILMTKQWLKALKLNSHSGTELLYPHEYDCVNYKKNRQKHDSWQNLQSSWTENTLKIEDLPTNENKDGGKNITPSFQQKFTLGDIFIEQMEAMFTVESGNSVKRRHYFANPSRIHSHLSYLINNMLATCGSTNRR